MVSNCWCRYASFYNRWLSRTPDKWRCFIGFEHIHMIDDYEIVRSCLESVCTISYSLIVSNHSRDHHDSTVLLCCEAMDTRYV